MMLGRMAMMAASNATLWTPEQITTSLWLDAADSSTVATVSGAVSQWNDKSGNSRHATQSTAGRRPAYTISGLNGKGIITFDGNDDVLITTSASYAAVNYFMVCRWISPVTSDAVFTARPSNSGKGGNSDIGVSLHTPNGAALSNFGTAFNANFASTYAQINATDVPSLSLFNSFNSGSGAIPASWFLFDMAIISTNAGAKVFSLGADILGDATYRTLNCEIAEFVIAPTQLSTGNRQITQGYLAHKWGLNANLPVGHPYKSAPPYI